MADPESLREIAHSRVPFSTWVGVVLLFALFGLIVLATIGPAPRGDAYEQKRAKAREEKLKALHEEDAKALATYGWIDKTKGVARVPIDRAMELTVAELARKKPAPANPIATPEPQASAAPTGAAGPTPAPTASPTATGTPKATSVAGPSSEARGQPAAAVKPPPAPAAKAPSAPTAPSPAASASPSPGKTP